MPRARRFESAVAVLLAAAALSTCSDPDRQRARQTTLPTYDKQTGKLTQLTYDRNKDGRIDTWTDMDGARPLRSRIDLDQDGKIDRWEYYDAIGRLAKVGFSRTHGAAPDAWAYADKAGRVIRIEVSSAGDEKRIDRWEHYDASRPVTDGDLSRALVSAEMDTNGDGRPDKWETYKSGALRTVTFDENGDGMADRRLTYDDGRLVKIESAPNASGRFTRSVDVK